MAIAYTVTINKVTVYGDMRIVYVTLASPASGSNTYTAGGDSITPAQVGLDYIDYADAGDLNLGGTPATGYAVNMIPNGSSACKVQLFGGGASAGAVLQEPSGGTAVASGTIIAEFRGV